jgi:hypothetical protein
VLAMSVAPPSGQNRIMIYGPKPGGTYVVEFKTVAGEGLAISIPATETRVIRYFQERMPYGLSVPGRSVRNFRRALIVFPSGNYELSATLFFGIAFAVRVSSWTGFSLVAL